MSVKTFDRCAELCRSEAACEVFTHDARRNRCLLRRGNFRKKNDVNSRFTSGPQSCPEPLCGAQFQRFRSGVEIRKIKGIVDPKGCQNLCVLHIDCEEWTHDASDDECFLRQGAFLESDPSGRFFAGTKECAFLERYSLELKCNYLVVLWFGSSTPRNILETCYGFACSMTIFLDLVVVVVLHHIVQDRHTALRQQSSFLCIAAAHQRNLETSKVWPTASLARAFFGSDWDVG